LPQVLSSSNSASNSVIDICESIAVIGWKPT
jgi:hypothetical protein